MGVATQMEYLRVARHASSTEHLQRRRKLQAFQSTLVFRGRNVLPDRDLCR
jgi:hypothetical protein